MIVSLPLGCGLCSGHPVAPQDFQQQMDHLAQRWQQLGQREEQLRDDTIKFNAFLKV